MRYYQPNFYKFSEDSLFLSHIFIQKEKALRKHQRRLLDLGAGCGIIGFEIIRRFTEFRLFSCDVQELEFLPYWRRNCCLLNLNKRAWFISSLCVDMEKFDYIVSNPPFFIRYQGRQPLDKRRDRCRFWTLDEARRWYDMCFNRLKEKGVLYILQRENFLENLDLKGFSLQEVLEGPGCFLYIFLRL